MEPTPLAVSLFPGFRDGIAGIDRTIDGVAGFDPAHLTPPLPHRAVGTRRDRLLPVDPPRGPRDALRTCASRPCRWTCRRCPNGSRRARSTSRSPRRRSPAASSTSCSSRRRYAVLMSRDHPFASPPTGSSLEDYIAADQVVVAGDSGLPRLESALRRAGAVLRSDVVLNHFASLPSLLAASPDLLATVPDTIAHGLGAELAPVGPASSPRDAARRGLPVPPHHHAAARRAGLALSHGRPRRARDARRVLRDPRERGARTVKRGCHGIRSSSEPGDSRRAGGRRPPARHECSGWMCPSLPAVRRCRAVRQPPWYSVRPCSA